MSVFVFAHAPTYNERVDLQAANEIRPTIKVL